ncbi:MAG: LytR/AlgR family response regulator transcription factor [Gemmatimonadota bacterium]
MADPIRVVLVDDEPPARAKLRRFLAADPRVVVAGEAGGGVEAVGEIERVEPDVVFLDIRMPELDGFGVLDALELDPLPHIVFVTAFDEYAVRAFEVRALDYLLKPADRERVRRAVDHAVEAVAASHDAADLAARIRDVLADARARAGPLERFLVRQRGRMMLVRAADVDWIEAADNYVRLHLGDESFLVRSTLKEVEARLDTARFARVHRSAIVSLDAVREVRPWSHGDAVLVLRSGAEVRLSRRYRDRLPGVLGG